MRRRRSLASGARMCSSTTSGFRFSVSLLFSTVLGVPYGYQNEARWAALDWAGELHGNEYNVEQ